MGYFHRVARPTYMGIVAGYIGWSLERTQEMFDQLVEEKVIRPLTVDEKLAQKLREDANLYVLVEKPSCAKARW